MVDVFLKLLNMSITASWLVLVVLILRVILKKAPKWINCLLWAFVAVRLVCPFSFESVLSLVPSAETVPQDILYVQEPVIQSGVNALNDVVNPILSEGFTPTVGDSANPMQIATFAATVIWTVGMVVMILYAGISYLRIHRKVAASMGQKDNIYICDYIETPFILGIIRPKIYVPSILDEETKEYVIAHEKAHIKRRDYWWKPFGYALLSIYWFNPLMWVAYVLLCKDIELACDERVIRELGEADKKSYSEALLFCSTPRKMIVACPLAFGEVGVKERVKMVLHYKKPAFWMIVVAVIICIVVAVCFLTNPKENQRASEAFGHIYVAEDVVYDASQEDILNLVSTPETKPLYCFTADYVLRNTIVSIVRYSDWRTLGSMTEVELTKDNFDAYFREKNSYGWQGDYSAGELRNDNKKSWQLLNNTGSYYLLQQKNGDVYLAYWDYDAEREQDPESDDSTMKYVVKLIRADYVTCTIETPEESAFYEMEWYPGKEFNIYHKDVPSYTMNTEGTLVFHVDADADTLLVEEEYGYEYSDGSYTKEETGEYTLVKNGEGEFALDISRADAQPGAFVMYYVYYNGGVYVIKIELPVGENSKVDTSDKTLKEHGLDMVSLMAEATRSDEYVQAYTASTEITEIVQSIGEGDFSAPKAVYSLTVGDEALLGFAELGEMEGASEELKSNLKSRVLASLITQLNGMSGVENLAAASVCTLGKTFVNNSVANDVIYIYTYENATPVAVTFTVGENGSVSASGNFIMYEEFPCNSAEEIEAFFSELGVVVEEVK